MSLLAAAVVAVASLASAAPPEEQAAELAHLAQTRDARMGWWREARFGMFIHWGLYSGAGGVWNGKVYPQHYAEWIEHWAAVPCAEYAKAMKPLFTPDPGFADEWADLAARAGMRYAVMTAKHHEGFTLFNSKQPYSLDNAVTGGTNISPPGRDLAREFADAMRARGLKPGFYYSLLDWQHPDAYEMALPAYPKDQHVRDHARYVEYVRGHVNELLTSYGPLCTIWFDYSDAQRQGEAWGAANLLRDLREKQPNIVVNNRLFQGLENPHGDYGTPEKYVPPTGIAGMDWEVNHTLNESYGFSSHDANWKDGPTVIRLLCDVVSKGGNLLLNIGPDAKGHVPPKAREALLAVGEWMTINAEAIRGTQASPFARLPWGRATRKPGSLHLMIFDWPADGRLFVPMDGVVKSATLLGVAEPLRLESSRAPGSGLTLHLPSKAPAWACPVVRLELAGDIAPLPFAVRPDAAGLISLLPHDATLSGPSLRVEQVGEVGDVQYNLGYWLDRSATATWPMHLDADHDGVYSVEAVVGCADAAAGSRLRLELTGTSQALEFSVPGTGGWQQYRTVSLGELTLTSGDQSLVARALTKTGEAVVNIRSIRLTRKR
jgi:alpha-L-fucosidase